MSRDRCYNIPTRDGSSSIRIRAGRRPCQRTVKALQDLFDAARRMLADRANAGNIRSSSTDEKSYGEKESG